MKHLLLKWNTSLLIVTIFLLCTISFLWFNSIQGETVVVECQNSHPVSHGKELNVADVKRGVEVVVPSEKTFSKLAASKSMISTAYLFLLAIISAAMLFLYLVQRRQAAELEIRVSERTKELNELNMSLEFIVEEKSRALVERERIMIHQSRLAAMGEMVGNIAHQWRQPLNSLSLILRTIDLKTHSGKMTPELMTKKVEEGLNIASQMSETIEDFRTFYKPDKEPVVFEVTKTVERAINLIIEQLKDAGIEIKTALGDNIKAAGYPNEFSQIMLNLFVNAKEAMENTTNRHLLKVNSFLSDTHVTVEVTDTGGGITKEAQKQLFEPYFTTKQQFNGTGIGLYMSKQILGHMNGTIRWENVNEEGLDGAKFIITIPKGEA